MGRVWSSFNSYGIFVFGFNIFLSQISSLWLRLLLIFEEPVIQSEGRNVISCFERRAGSRRSWDLFVPPQLTCNAVRHAAAKSL